MQQIYTPNYHYKVLCYCTTYNQAKYIEDTLNGFVLQETDFPFVCLVVDDCSTDGEQEIIKQWMYRECEMSKAEHIEIELSNIILVQHKTNRNCIFAFYLLKRNLWKERELKNALVAPWREHCEYEAMCEGDDYWTSPDKISIQAKCLDSNPTFSLVHTGFDFLYERDGHLETSAPIFTCDIGLEQTREILNYNRYRIQTCTVMLRNEFYLEILHNKFDCFDSNRFFMSDTQSWVLLSMMGPIHYIDKKTSVYRVCLESACRTSDLRKDLRFKISASEMRVYIVKKFNLGLELERKFLKDCSRLYAKYLPIDNDFVPLYNVQIFDRIKMPLYWLHYKLKKTGRF